eukprot:2089465-Rhodomonas_salina.3
MRRDRPSSLRSVTVLTQARRALLRRLPDHDVLRLFGSEIQCVVWIVKCGTIQCAVWMAKFEFNTNPHLAQGMSLPHCLPALFRTSISLPPLQHRRLFSSSSAQEAHSRDPPRSLGKLAEPSESMVIALCSSHLCLFTSSSARFRCSASSHHLNSPFNENRGRTTT